MRKVREVLRLRFEVGCSHRAIQASTGLSKGSVSDYLKRAATRGLTWPEAQSMSDADVEATLFHAVGRSEPPGRVPIDFAWVHADRLVHNAHVVALRGPSMRKKKAIGSETTTWRPV